MRKTWILSVFIILSSICAVQAQSVPNVRVTIPERFRVLTNQWFDLRIEAENLSSPTARVVVDINSDVKEELTYAGPLEATSDNDANPSNIDKAWTFRKAYFATPGLKTIMVYVVDGR